jgi:hypothetical protein
MNPAQLTATASVPVLTRKHFEANWDFSPGTGSTSLIFVIFGLVNQIGFVAY